MSEQSKYFKNNIRLLCNRKGMGNINLALKTSISEVTVGHWFTGYSFPTAPQLKKISDALKVSIDDLIRIDVRKYSSNQLKIRYNIIQNYLAIK